jgi:hypothetical protein
MCVNSVLEDYFETQVSDFGNCPETQMYLATRHALIDTYETAALEVKIREVCEKALFHALAVLRLDAGDGIETRYVTPFILLNLHRDDDAFDFIRYWMKITGQETTEEFWIRLQTQEGEWTYQREKNCRFLDIYQEVPTANEHNVPLAFLMAILIIKLRIVATYDATCRSIDLAFQTTGGRHIHMIQNAVKDILLGDRVKMIENQRQQVERLINVIHDNNRYIFSLIVDPVPQITLVAPSDRIRGRPSEAEFVLRYCIRCNSRIPGVMEMLERRFG